MVYFFVKIKMSLFLRALMQQPAVVSPIPGGRKYNGYPEKKGG